MTDPSSVDARVERSDPPPTSVGRRQSRTARPHPDLVRAWAPLAAAVLALGWAYRTMVFGGGLLGNDGDARYTVAIYDHWYRVWQGLDGVRDLVFYYPLRTTLGTSDAFFVQGQIYSLGRVLGLDVLDAWVVATLGFATIGAVGVAALSRRLFAGVGTQVAFVVLSVGSYPVVVAAGHPQLLGFYTGSWVVLGLLQIRAGRTLRGVATVAIWSALLALSSWYAVVLLGVVLVFLFLVRAVVVRRPGKRPVRELAAEVWAVARTARGAAAIVFSVVGWLAAVWIYLPGAAILPPPTWLETVIYSPRWSDIWNASGNGGGIWGPLYDHLYPVGSYNGEQQLGFTPVLFLALLAATVVLVRMGRESDRPEAESDPVDAPAPTTDLPRRDAVLAAAVTCAVVIAFFLVDERLLGLFRPVWEYVPGMSSIRAPFRVMIYLYPVAFFVVLRTAELVTSRQRSARRGLALATTALLVVAIFVEAQRPLESAWGRADLLPADLSRTVPTVRRDCDAVVVRAADPSRKPYEVQIDAIALALESDVPTPQGYSRASPERYPDSASGPRRYLRWMERNGFEGTLCAVDDEGVRVVGSSR